MKRWILPAFSKGFLVPPYINFGSHVDNGIEVITDCNFVCHTHYNLSGTWGSYKQYEQYNRYTDFMNDKERYILYFREKDLITIEE